MIRVSAVAGVLVLALLASAGCADNLLKERPTTKAARGDRRAAHVLGGGERQGGVECVRGVSAAAPGGAAPAGAQTGQGRGRRAEGEGAVAQRDHRRRVRIVVAL